MGEVQPRLLRANVLDPVKVTSGHEEHVRSKGRKGSLVDEDLDGSDNDKKVLAATWVGSVRSSSSRSVRVPRKDSGVKLIDHAHHRIPPCVLDRLLATRRNQHDPRRTELLLAEYLLEPIGLIGDRSKSNTRVRHVDF